MNTYFSYLIDQQCSQRMHIDVVSPKKTYQPIVVSTVTAMFGDHKDEILKLSRQQALELAKRLQAAALQVPVIPNDCEYKGYVID